MVDAAGSIFQTASFLPLIVVVFFAAAWLYDHRRKRSAAAPARFVAGQAKS